ncbi:MAG: hypothetical protein HS115_01865 [Spirochaetales bacterium]|nr:hypothetical protein [Spirochaetales bacterium]
MKMVGRSFLFLFLLSISSSGSFASEGGNGREVKAQIQAEHGLKKNQEYLTLINPAISNYGTEMEKAVYKRCINLHLQAQILYLAFQFQKAYDHVRRTQELLIKLYVEVIETSRLRVFRELTFFAADVFKDKYNVKANKYMKLGIRDLEVVQAKLINQHNTRPWLYILKLNDLGDALKLVRHASRYAMLLRIMYQSIYRTPVPEQLSYVEGARIISSGFPGRQKELLTNHADNYFKIGMESRNLLVQYTETPELAILKEKLPGWDEGENI